MLKDKLRRAWVLPPAPDPGRDLLAARRAAMEERWRAAGSGAVPVPAHPFSKSDQAAW
jgi:hypothetical protein